jgi:hypothetical protein
VEQQHVSGAIEAGAGRQMRTGGGEHDAARSH